MWFRELVGFDESARAVHEHLTLDEPFLVSRLDGRRLRCGSLSLPSLRDLRTQMRLRTGRPRLREVVGDVRALHADPDNAGAVFQVASQFNLLEMISPSVTPEMGVDGYENDRTQGPACAMCAGAATLMRNWLVEIDGHLGQTADRQLDAFADVGALLGNTGDLWKMRNGYALFEPQAESQLASRLAHTSNAALQGALRVGLHADVGVTLPGARHSVTQVFGSALPLAYMESPGPSVRMLAQQVLLASYEATLRIAAMQASKSGSERVYLTLLGGGVFGNRLEWILDAIQSAARIPGLGPLDIRIVSYGHSNPAVAALKSR